MRFFLGISVLMGVALGAAHAQGNYEIQVYGADTVAPRTTMVELHSNFTADGQAATADLLEKARARGYEFEILAKPVHPQDLLNKLRG